MRVKFLVTQECGRLVRWLRLMGYDSATGSTQSLSGLYRRAYNESRIVVTRTRKVGASCLVRVIQLTSTDHDDQLRQVMQEVRLAVDDEALFTRCDQCNVPVQPIPKTQVKDRVPPYVYTSQDVFHACPSCKRIYWAATHWDRACRVFDRLRKETNHA